MKNGILKLSWVNIKSAIAYGVTTMAFTSLITVIAYIQQQGTIFGLDWKHIIDLGVMAAAGGFVATISLIKNALTTDEGNFLGVVKVIPDKKY